MQHLEQAYQALTVADVARRTSPNPDDHAETANYLLDLISRGVLNAEVSGGSSDEPATWVLRFNSFAGNEIHLQSEEQQYAALRRQIDKVAALTEDVREIDRQLGLGKEYIHDAKLKLRLSKDNPTESDLNAANALVGQEFFTHDEDMMEDV